MLRRQPGGSDTISYYLYNILFWKKLKADWS